MAAVIEPAAPPAAPAAPGKPSVAPASAGVINVTPPSTVPTKVEAVPEESAKGKMFTELGKKVKPTNAPREEKAPADTKVAEARSTETSAEEVSDKGKTATDADLAAKPGDDGKKGKVNPWKMVDEYKAKLATAEKELLAAKSAVVPENDRKSYDDRITKAEARAKELEQHMQYVDYSKTEEFKTKYVAPYEKAWANAMGELKEITISDPATGNERAVTPNDLLDLVNLPLGKAREIADEVFGKFSDDVMAHRKEIQNLYKAQTQALEDAKTNGAERVKQAHEAQARQTTEVNKFIGETWTKENESAAKDPTYGQFFTPHEGDENWNKRLAKGFELVDRAFAENPMDPKLKPEERAAVIRRHAAIRNRAASWGAIRGENEALTAKIAAMEKELSEYKGSEPGAGGGKSGANGAPIQGDAKSQMFGALQKIARRG
jgi:hypothetical protein